MIAHSRGIWNEKGRQGKAGQLGAGGSTRPANGEVDVGIDFLHVLDKMMYIRLDAPCRIDCFHFLAILQSRNMLDLDRNALLDGTGNRPGHDFVEYPCTATAPHHEDAERIVRTVLTAGLGTRLLKRLAQRHAGGFDVVVLEIEARLVETDGNGMCLAGQQTYGTTRQEVGLVQNVGDLERSCGFHRPERGIAPHSQNHIGGVLAHLRECKPVGLVEPVGRQETPKRNSELEAL